MRIEMRREIKKEERSLVLPLAHAGSDAKKELTVDSNLAIRPVCPCKTQRVGKATALYTENRKEWRPAFRDCSREGFLLRKCSLTGLKHRGIILSQNLGMSFITKFSQHEFSGSFQGAQSVG